MLIGRVELTEKGIRIFDVDESSQDIIAADALDLAKWIKHREFKLVLMIQVAEIEQKKREQENGNEHGRR